jgi:hypothetical protein
MKYHHRKKNNEECNDAPFAFLVRLFDVDNDALRRPLEFAKAIQGKFPRITYSHKVVGMPPQQFLDAV